MSEPNFKDKAKKLLSLAGVEINGHQPYDIQVYNDHFYQKILAKGSLGLGESYVDHWWDSPNVDEFINRILIYRLDEKVRLKTRMVLQVLIAKIINTQNESRAAKSAQKHYDMGNDLFTAMLDKRLTYTCGYWKYADTLDKAQEDKFELVCQKLNLQQGQKILDIGCGWGSFVKYAAERHCVSSVGITVSPEQVKLGKELCKGLPIEIKLLDYREMNGTFDHIVSLGMFEHVGFKNYRRFMQVAHKCLKDDGLLLLHCIGGNFSVRHTDPWINKYVFPNSMLPSIKQIGQAIERLFVMEDWHNFGADYDKTLMAWYRNLSNNWDRLNNAYSENFHRLYNYYLLSCAGSFRARKNQLWQIVLSKHGIQGGYQSIRTIV